MSGKGYYSSSDEENQKSRFNGDATHWDIFEDPSGKGKAGSSTEATERFDSFVRVVKFIVCIIVFILILSSSVVSKMALLFMTSHIPEGRKIPFCENQRENQNLVAEIPTQQRVAWIWAIIFAYAVPELGTFLRSARMCIFKTMQWPKFGQFCIVFLAETAHTIGMALLMIMVLPKLDVIQGVVLTNCLCFLPAVLSLFADWYKNVSEGWIISKLKLPLNILAIFAQLTGFIVWPLMYQHHDSMIWVIPAATLCISVHWWENYVSDKSRFSFVVYLNRVKESLAETRYATYLYISMWKMIVFTLSAILLSDIKFTQFFTDFIEGFGKHNITISESNPTNSTDDVFAPYHLSATGVIWWTLLIQVATSYACYIFTKFTCKIQIQSFSFGLPINLTVPITVSVLFVLCNVRKNNVCAFQDLLPDYLFFNPPSYYKLYEYIVDKFAWISLVWLLSQTWITRHIWTPKSNKNASTDNLFITPLYNGLIIDQSLPLNRRREDLSVVIPKDDVYHKRCKVYPEDKISQILICATMWHENKEEMMKFLKSIIRLDEDQSARRLARKYIQDNGDDIDPNYYDLETHIFFDDAFITDKSKKRNTEDNPINEYVKTLIASIPDAAREVYKTEIKICEPQKFVTPYGGRLVFTLPGKTKMIAHLKHADKIRKKKRWSQVMYMYYLLGHRIMQLNISDDRKLIISQNTFLLALDGDIDFQPNALHLLINRMKVDENLGAACGRILPIGCGPMVWFQKFEYAIGHWLQKSTEHVIGCVLCSPGCFSLFRARALMENSVVRKYATKSEEALHFVQYDQGEDRWLCTLLLKQKFRIEYSAASDAYTHSPEGFNEFFNQRRRWIPATMVNVLDLLMNAKDIVETNDSISMLYITYQCMLMVGTILGPGTIFLMMIGSLVTVFGVGIWTAFLWNLIPLVGFMIICYWCKQKYQLMAAFIISAIYSLVMMAVLIGITILIITDGPVAPTSVFFFAVTAQIVIAGILHPQEIGCLIHGIIYYLTIPSMYMLLVIYSLFNMNDVSWGTRETPKALELNNPNIEGERYDTQGKGERNSGLDVSLCGLLHCKFAQHNPSKPHNEPNIITENENDTESMRSSHTVSVTDDSILEEPSPNLCDWLYDPDIRNAELGTLSYSEKKFWTELIKKYLKPLDLSKQQLDDNKEKLKVLRDNAVFAFMMINALFVLTIFLLQLNSDTLHIVWPWGANVDEETGEIIYLRLEPIGLLFVGFFGIILLIQFSAMLIHRFGTASQILAATDLNCYCARKSNEMLPEADMRGKAVSIAKRLQKPKPQWDEALDKEQQKIGERRDTIKKIRNQRLEKQNDYSDLERNFTTAFLVADVLNLGDLKLTRKIILMLNKRRTTIKARQSIAQPTEAVSVATDILINNSRPSFINQGDQSAYSHSDNLSFEPDFINTKGIDKISLNNENENSMPRLNRRANNGTSPKVHYAVNFA